MRQVVVTVTAEKGRTICDPARVDVGSGDTVQWTCAEGELAVDFGEQTPFTSTQVWRADRGQMTPVAVVNPGAPTGTVFRPAISIDGAVVAKSLGDLIVRKAAKGDS